MEPLFSSNTRLLRIFLSSLPDFQEDELELLKAKYSIATEEVISIGRKAKIIRCIDSHIAIRNALTSGDKMPWE